MHIITDLLEARAFAKNMSQSLDDVAYWQKWYILSLSTQPRLDWIKQAKATALLRAMLPDGDGSILWLDGSLLVVFQEADTCDCDKLAKNLRKAAGVDDVTSTLLNVADEPEKVKTLLGEAQGNAWQMRKPPAASYQFLKSLVPNIEALLRGWHEQRPKHEGRDKPHIMIVDDDPMTVRLVSRALAREYEVITAASGAEAIAKHLQLMPDIIFLDINLPDCDGLTLLDYMQQYDQDCRIVMFSADDFVRTRVQAFAAGAKGFLGKPFNLRAFQNQIAAWFAGRNKK